MQRSEWVRREKVPYLVTGRPELPLPKRSSSNVMRWGLTSFVDPDLGDLPDGEL